MSEQDRYIPGVPCWIDTTQPDPDAAAAFYGELFGWEFEDVMPPGAPAVLHRPPARRGTSAAISSLPEGAPPPRPGTPTSGSTDADETAAKVRDAGGTVLMEPVRRRRRRADGRVRRPEGATFSVWQAEGRTAARGSSTSPAR